MSHNAVYTDSLGATNIGSYVPCALFDKELPSIPERPCSASIEHPAVWYVPAFFRKSEQGCRIQGPNAAERSCSGATYEICSATQRLASVINLADSTESNVCGSFSMRVEAKTQVCFGISPCPHLALDQLVRLHTSLFNHHHISTLPLLSSVLCELSRWRTPPPLHTTAIASS